MMLILSILAILLRLNLSSSLPDFNEPCRFQNVCSDRSGQTTPGNVSFECCSPCSCSETCTLLGICCPGHNNTPRSTPPFPCRKQAVIFKKYLNRTRTATGAPAYRVIDECPLEYQKEKVIEESVSRCKRAKELTDLIFVTGRQSGLTYLNEHCARCNGEDDLVNWDLYLTDRANDLVFSSFEERDEMLLRRSIFKVVPPSTHVARLSYCKTSSIGKCNETGLWDHYDKDLETDCLSHHSYFSFDYPPKRKAYVNVYCYMCNVPKSTILLKQCRTPNEINEIFDLNLKGGIVRPFSVLVVPRKKTSAISVPVEKTCSVGEILDTIQNRCTSLICPPGTISNHGICRPVIGRVIGYVVLLRMTLIIDSKPNLQPADYQILLEELENFTKTITKKKGIICHVCSGRISRLADDRIIWEQPVRSGEKCNYIAMLRILFLSYKTFPVVVYSENLQSNVTLTYSNINTGYRSVEYFMGDNYNICIPNIVYAPTVVHCPSLIFNKTSMSEKCDDSCFHTKIDPFSFPLGNGTYIICTDIYKKALSSVNQAYVTGFDVSVMSILLTFYILNQLRYMHIQM